MPILLKGTENVTTLGVTFLMTMTSAGDAGMSFEDMLLLADVENGLSEV